MFINFIPKLDKDLLPSVDQDINPYSFYLLHELTN